MTSLHRNIVVRPQWLRRCHESSTGFRAQLPSSSANSFPYTPVLLFINKRSGGHVGEHIYRQLLRTLNPRQIFLLENNDTINNALDIYASLPNLRICVFGGDGTVGWVLGCLAERYPLGNNPPVSICPLGTGNDLSRVLSWGEEYDPKRLQNILLLTAQAQIVPLDRWQCRLEQFEPSPSSSTARSYIDRIRQIFVVQPKFVQDAHRALYSKHHDLPNTRFINYMSFGLDAAVALDFHDERTRNPSKFSSPLKNKLMYLNETGKYLSEFAQANMWDLKPYIRLICDGRDLTDDIHQCHTLIVLNIPGYAAGTNPWGKASDTDQTDPFGRQDFGDRKIEVVGLSTTHMATIHVGLSGKRLAQCQQLRIELLSPMTAQMDGEPFYLPTSIAININHAGQVLMLRNGI